MLEDIIKQRDEEARDSFERHESLDWDQCQMCEIVGDDKRTLVMRCFYDLIEIVPEFMSLELVNDGKYRERDEKVTNQYTLKEGHPFRNFYLLRICKRCRAELLGFLRLWAVMCRTRRGSAMDHDGNPDDVDPEATIPVRMGGTTVMLRPDQMNGYDEWRQATSN